MLQRSMVRGMSVIAILAASVLAGCSKQEEASPPAETPPPSAAEAPAPAAAQSENVHRFKIGELDALALRDGFFEFPNDLKIFGLGHPQEEVNALLSANNLPTDKLHLSVQPLLVKAGERVLLFDVGPAALFGPTGGKLPAALAEAGVDPASVTDIFISHSHGDHVGGLVNTEGKLAFPNAAIHITNAEWQHMSGNEQYKALNAAIKDKVDAFAPDAELVPGAVKAVDIQGHTPGHSGYRITSGAASLLYVGDTVHHYVISVQKADWPMSFDGDQTLGAKSRVALIADSATRAQRIYAVHFPFPGIGTFEKRGDAHVWVPE